MGRLRHTRCWCVARRSRTHDRRRLARAHGRATLRGAFVPQPSRLARLRGRRYHRFTKCNDLARPVRAFGDVKAQADDGVCTDVVRTFVDGFECLRAQVFRVGQELTRRNADQHTEAAKCGTQAVSRARRDARHIAEATHHAIPVEGIEGHDVVVRDHGACPGQASRAGRREGCRDDMPESSPSVLIIRLDAIGDALALTPMLAALRARGVPVDLVLCDVNARVFSPRAAHRVYEAPFAMRSNTRENLDVISAFGADLQANGYSHVLVATEDPGGYRLAHAVNAPTRIGFVNGVGKLLKTIWARTQLTQTIHRTAGLDVRAPHECDVLFRLARPLLGDGARPTRDLALLQPLVLDSDVARDARVAFQITDKWERLRIDRDEVVDALTRMQTIVEIRGIAARAEERYARTVADASGIALEVFDDVGAWKIAIAQARALVAPDSGALHVAGMIGTPVVAVFPTGPDFTLQSSRWSPWAAPYRAVEARSGWPHEATDALLRLLG